MDPTTPADSVCWKEGKDIFLKSLQESSKPPTQLAIVNFLKDNWDLSRTIANCETLQVKADGEYNKKKGGRFVRKLLDGLMMVKSIADPFLEFAPETVSIAWCAISGLITIAATDIENCGVISDACNNIVSIILTCRIYENRYHQNVETIGDREVESKIMQAIPNIISLIFDFSWYIKNHLGESRIKRNFKEAFSPKLKDKVQAIDDEYRKVRGIANDAFQERVMDSVEDKVGEPNGQVLPTSFRKFSLNNISLVMQRDKEELQNILFPALQDISEKLNEIHVVKGTLDLLKLRQELQTKRKLFQPNGTHTRIFRSIFEPVANHSEVLCQWLFTDENYLSWEQAPIQKQNTNEEIETQELEVSRKVFYLRGRPGFGKSVAMSCVLQRLTTNLKIPVCYFFFRQGDDSTQLTIRALESLVAQILDETWVNSEVKLAELISLISNADERQEHGEGDTAASPVTNPSSLGNLLGRAIEIINRPVYILLDALDECVDHESQGLVQQILSLVETSKTTKLIFSSRIGIGVEPLLKAPAFSTDEDLLDCIVSDMAVIMTITEERTSEDMELYLRQSLGKIMVRRSIGNGKVPSFKPTEDAEKMILSIKQKANGMFTYAAMVIASLEQPSSLTLAQRLKRLPDGMDALYRGRLESMGIAEKKLVLLALKWVVWANEKIDAVVIAENFKNIYGPITADAEDESDHESSTFKDFEEPRRTFRDSINDPEIAETIYHLKVIGRDFFRIDGETYEIDVVHKSVRDWVENEAIKAGDREAQLKTIAPSFIFDAEGGVKLSLQLPSTFTNNGNSALIFQSKREVYLDFAIYQLHILNSPIFQKRHMPYQDPSARPQDSEGAEIVQPGLLVKKGDHVESSEDPKNQQNTHPPFEDATQDRGGFALRFQKEKRKYRYEVRTLLQHLRILEDTKMWPMQDKKGEKWDRFWAKFAEFAKPENYKRWKIQYNQFHLNRSESDAYNPTLYQGILHIAAKSALPTTVEYLLENKLARVEEEDGNGSTALAVSDMNPQVWRILLDHGASTSRVDPVSGETIWQKAWPSLVEHCDSGNALLIKSIEDCCELLIQRETDFNQPCGLSCANATALHMAAVAGSWPLFDALMKNPKIDVKAEDLYRNNALHYIFQWVPPGSEEIRNRMVAALIDAGLDANAENGDSATPLLSAISQQVEGSVRLLLEGGADPTDESVGGYSALHWAAARRIKFQGSTNHEKALRIFKIILSKDPVIGRETPDGTTPLEMAFQTWNWSFVEAIMGAYKEKYGGGLEYLMRRDSYNRNFLHHCTFNSRWGLDIAKELILLTPKERLDELLADKSTFLGRKTRGLPGVSSKQRNSGGTPLLNAFQEGSAGLAALYLRSGADIATKSTAHLNCLEETVIGWYSAKSQSTGAGEEGLETEEEKTKRYEACCHLILDSCKELVQSSSPAILHYLVAKGALDLIRRVMECGIDYRYADIEGWTVVEWAQAFKQQEALDLVTKIANSRDEDIKINQPSRQIPGPTKLVVERRQTPQKADGAKLSDEGLGFRVSERHLVDVHSMTFDRPVPPTAGVSYFEVTFLEGETKLMCCVGFSGELFRLDRATGSSSEAGDESFGLLGVNGWSFSNSKPVDGPTLKTPVTGGALTFGKGDTVGCGLDIDEGTIFYTLNGEYAGVAFENVYGRWYGTVSCGVDCGGKVNLGSEPFMFQEMNEYLKKKHSQGF
ncbi:hypothetical protein TWF718_003703 [Orbilia javanica]|uniref:B30.2/SPRY domain-containing protein n=1 Tax=Orbilia javanica TaxID=47235 RepID=A0AAN8N188_9PEZI